ncbi:hypothetical protein [Streptomyces montanus]|nr:hypothetical protein [Streptomyces montanus]
MHGWLPRSRPGHTTRLGTGEPYTVVVIDLAVEVLAGTTGTPLWR